MFTGRKDADVKGTSAQATNAAAVVTLDEGPGNRVHLSRVVWSYSATPTNGRLTIAVDGATRGTWAITAAGPAPLGVNIRAARPITVTLAAGGVGVVGDVYCEYFDR